MLNVNDYNFKLPAFGYVSSAVGAGKTHWAIEMMIDRSLENYLYVAPTVELCRELEGRIEKADARGVKTVRRVDSEHNQGVVVETILELVNQTKSNDGTIIIITKTSFLQLLEEMEERLHPLWNVIMDEAFNPISHIKINGEHLNLIFDNIKFTKSNSIKPKSVKRMEELLNGNKETAIADNKVLAPLFRQIMGSVETVEMANPLKKEDVKKQVVMASYIDYKAFAKFKEVLFMVALFEQTNLYRLWAAQDVVFSEHSYFKHKLNQVHKMKGPLSSFGYLMNKEDTTSMNRFTQDYMTGEQNNKGYKDGLVIHELINQTEEYLKDGYLISLNKWVKAKTLSFKGGIRLPVVVNGLDKYKSYTKIACLTTTNPDDVLANWIADRTGMTIEDVRTSHRIHTIYQAIGRTALRDEHSNEPLTFIIAGEVDAWELYEMFPDATWLGKVGSMLKVPPRPPKKKAVKVGEVPEYKKLQGRIKQVRLNKKLALKQGRDASDWASEEVRLALEMVNMKARLKAEEAETHP